MNKRIIGIDYGIKRIGLALSDERHVIAMPSGTVFCEHKLELTLAKLVEELNRLQEKYHCEITEIVVGIPLKLDGKMGLMADEVKLFGESLQKLVKGSVIFWDERLSSIQAERSLREKQMNRKKRSQVIDTVSAAIILQSYLDSKPR
jgi:putative Holliday junction resolvase